MFSVDVSTILNSTTVDEALDISPTIKPVLILINAVIVILGIAGNSILLVAVQKYNAIDLDKVFILFLTHVAIADLLVTIAYFLPMLVTLASSTWVFGSVICYIVACLRDPLIELEMCIITVTSCYKLYRLCSPLTPPMETSTGVVIAILCWVFCAGIALVDISTSKAEYKASFISCHLHATAKWTWIETEIDTLKNAILIASVVIIIIVNIAILYIATRRHHHMNNLTANARRISVSLLVNYKAVKTVSLVCWVFVISYLPMLVYYEFKDRFPGVSVVFVWFLIGVNVVANPFIYTFTNQKFGEFCRMTCCCRLRNGVRSTTQRTATFPMPRVN